MSAGPRSPVGRWFPLAILASIVVAALSGWLFYRAEVRARSIDALSDGTREELAALDVPAVKTAEVERAWVAPGFKTESLVAPAGPMPCEGVSALVPPNQQSVVRDAWTASQQQDADVRIEQLAAINDASPNNLLVVQMLGTALVDAGRYPDAERVIAQGLGGTAEDEEIIRAAKASTALDLDDREVSTVIHLHHALGVARLSQSSAQPPWVSLKNVIGSVKPLSKRRLMGPTRDQPVWSRLLITAPGCAAGGAGPSLSSYDLFNNLIVGYMRGTFAGGDSERDREFARPKKNFPGAVHKLLLAQVQRARANGWQNEAQLWALSNVEQLIDWRMPDDARLAFNSVQVIDWWTSAERCPRDVCTAELLGEITGVRDKLIEQAFRRRNVADDQRTAFARGLLRMLATSSVNRAELAPSAAKIAEWLPPSERKTLEDLIAADAARVELPKWIFAKVDDDRPSTEVKEPPYAKLGSRAERWHSAALTDVASVAAMWAAGRSPREQRDVIVALRQLLGTSEAPPELLALEQKHTWTDRMTMRLIASKPFWAILGIAVAILVWLILAWLLVNLREWRLLRVSLYNVEVEHLARIDRGGDRR